MPETEQQQDNIILQPLQIALQVFFNAALSTSKYADDQLYTLFFSMLFFLITGRTGVVHIVTQPTAVPG